MRPSNPRAAAYLATECSTTWLGRPGGPSRRVLVMASIERSECSVPRMNIDPFDWRNECQRQWKLEARSPLSNASTTSTGEMGIDTLPSGTAIIPSGSKSIIATDRLCAGHKLFKEGQHRREIKFCKYVDSSPIGKVIHNQYHHKDILHCMGNRHKFVRIYHHASARKTWIF